MMRLLISLSAWTLILLHVAVVADSDLGPNIIVLNNDNFDQQVKAGNSNNWFVLFHSPSCPHCLRLLPTWQQLGAALSTDETIKIAAVDW